MKIKLDDPRLSKLWTEANRRGLKVYEECETVYRVSSHSVPGLFHRVVIEPDGITCSCPALCACTHIALVLAESSYLKWSEFFYAEQMRDREKRLKLEHKRWQKVFERRRADAMLMAELMAA